MISLDNISLALNNVPVLRNVSLQLEPATVTAVMGANGTGKTSLLRVTTGEWNSSEGSVKFHGRPIAEWAPAARAQMMAVLPQSSTLNFPFLVEEVVMLGRTPHDTGIKRDKEIVVEALASVDCMHLKDRFYTQLSGGEKQRVQFARVLAQIWDTTDREAPALILDEPTASFDIEHQLSMLRTVRAFAERGVIVIMVLHDINLAASCADQMVFLSCGSVAASGSPSEVVTAPNIKQIFNVDADITHLDGREAPLVIPKLAGKMI